MTITKALIIDEPWISKILSGEKDWEMRSTRCTHRGPFGLIKKGSGLIVGIADLVDVSGPYDEQGLLDNERHHHVGASIYKAPDYKWHFAWELSNVHRLSTPVPYVHKNGAVTWVTLDQKAAYELNNQLQSIDSFLNS